MQTMRREGRKLERDMHASAGTMMTVRGLQMKQYRVETPCLAKRGNQEVQPCADARKGAMRTNEAGTEP
jgi:hypothetical protein